ncbi:major facilitator superfamily MFS_1 [[Actinomadura] parvosata subsp. kistnae]|uniref:MFS transporter n=1 Tax=[Actinomadura] parvosata subsp. kistnae TaxID=1909395 RepID=A0A1V0A3L9_9ACTN|nr:MFS transporter [Nonomuraea sp. ATCC 55076]AQZ64800.1 MFS transporter [Nonomuraea sp. ATCC 55076]SPL98430.1 major facilitator superfamily MFS_1 [Actinomadura parvosata subsp. kistnae]
MSSRSPFKRRDFRLLLFGQTTAQLGTQVSGVAVPLLAVVTLDASPLQLGLITASGTVAFAVIGLPAGAWVDRWRRRPVLVGADLARAVVLATVPLAAMLGVLGIWQLVVVSLLAGVARVFFDVGYQSYLPSVVGREGLLAGNSAMESIRAGGQVAGPGVGGWAVSVLGAANVVLVQAVTFAVSAVSLLAIKAPEPAPVPAASGSAGLGAEIKEGLVVVLRTPVLRATAITSAAGNFAFAIASAVSFVFMVRTLGLSPTGIGLVLAAGSVAALAGAALTPVLARCAGSARVIWLALAVTGPVAMLSPLAGRGWGVGLLVVGTAAGELGQIVYAVTNVSLRQRLCPERMLGRVNATMRFLMMGLFPLGALLGGVLGEVAGARQTLWVAAVVVLLSPLPVYAALRGVRDVEDLDAALRE